MRNKRQSRQRVQAGSIQVTILLISSFSWILKFHRMRLSK